MACVKVPSRFEPVETSRELGLLMNTLKSLRDGKQRCRKTSSIVISTVMPNFEPV